MRDLPLKDPGTPDVRSPLRLLLRTAAQQRRSMAIGTAFGCAWMLAQAVLPAAVGKALDEGVLAGDDAALLRWAGVVLALALVTTVAAVLRHRYAVTNWLTACFRTLQQVGRHTARAGTAVTGRLPQGEVLASTSSDGPRVGDAFDVTQRAVASVLAVAVVALLVLRTSVPLGLVVLLGIPAVLVVLLVLLRPLKARQQHQRELSGQLTTLGTDTVRGLRILRGVGGEEVFLTRYRDKSQQVRAAGVRVAAWESGLEALQVLVPGLLVAALVWAGARATVRGEISPGELVALYGYAAFLTSPLRMLVEAADKYARALVAARRLVTLLEVPPLLTEPARPEHPPAGPLADPVSGVVAAPGELTVVVSDPPELAAPLGRRLARFDDSGDPAGSGDEGVALGGVPLRRVPVAEVRRRVLLAEDDAQLFSGTLREQVDPEGAHGDAQVLAAMEVADATGIVDLVDGGLRGVVTERGRSLSGGQRQRLALARALLRDPEVLVLVEPTSAVDAHTEARIAARLRAARAGRTTLVASGSPLVAPHADTVHWLRGGRLVASGRHADLLADPAYRRFVTRDAGGEGDAHGAPTAGGVPAQPTARRPVPAPLPGQET
ncbi:ABC transporter ATP-binding protein/permease [Paenibacillus sp. TRM 82003]|uniref:ABC transporter transmembrane domain-containing protein n=1 Tax=Kineococcus sp. TRM81007 TaxID=2925831 RepID=UPI001F571CC5|nr:ABC transporter ATP-binding protein [Kineococcus sp. TRM81007]MCI2238752.1 ABC transporter ATP-binding protein/permease [Kineococcus sp. TRM81007]MCI3924159.1 ABC transporter ATP-binding protein/permease [Paenibacillus sp. TRM 82003]